MTKDLLDVVEKYDCKVELKKKKGLFTTKKGMVAWVGDDIMLFIKELNGYVSLDDIKNFVF